jgi:hypothetical protein
VRSLIGRVALFAATMIVTVLLGFAGVAHAQTGSDGSDGSDSGTTTTTTATGAFDTTTSTTSAPSGVGNNSLAVTGIDTWLLASGAGLAAAGAVASRRLLRSRAR